MTTARDTAEAAPYAAQVAVGRDRPGDGRCNGCAAKAIFGPNTPRVLQFLIDLRNLSPAEIDAAASAWNEVNPLDRAVASAHVQAAATAEHPVTAAASAARRTAMDTARIAGRTDWAFWAAAWDAAAAITTEGLAEGDYQTLTHPLGTVMPALQRIAADEG
jgi:hypothetical protein